MKRKYRGFVINTDWPRGGETCLRTESMFSRSRSSTTSMEPESLYVIFLFLDKQAKFLYRYDVGCFTTGPQPIPNLILHTVRSSASSFNLQYILVSLISFNSCVRLLSHILVPYIFPSITCFRRQFLRKM
jgi:hypothetical protein